VPEIWPVIDSAIDLDDFNLEEWAASRGIPLRSDREKNFMPDMPDMQ
jgi:hypothetical protein